MDHYCQALYTCVTSDFYVFKSSGGKEYAFYNFVCTDSTYHKDLGFGKYSNHTCKMHDYHHHPLCENVGTWRVNVKLFEKFSNVGHFILHWIKRGSA